MGFAAFVAVAAVVDVALDLFQNGKGDAFAVMAPATGADIADDASITADRVAVHRVVDGTVAYAHFLHGLDDVFEGLEVVERVTVHFHIADVAAVGERVIGRFKAQLVEGVDGVDYVKLPMRQFNLKGVDGVSDVDSSPLEYIRVDSDDILIG